VLGTTRTTATLGVLALLLVGCNEGRSPASVAGPRPESQGATSTPSPSPVEVPTLKPTPAPASPTASPTPKPPSYDVKAVQTKLAALNYYAGPIDGTPGGALGSAVMAFQKVNGLDRDGGVGPKTLEALKTPVTPRLKGKGKGVRVEVDLTKQVLYVVKDDVITRILSVSSGSGQKYTTKSGYLATALSPVGYYAIQRRIIGAHKAELGVLYDPQFFYKGWAIHGSDSVPGYPASHGCTRVSRADATFLLRAIGVGTPVYVYGGTFTFPAGSSAPGTNDPGGDTGQVTPTPTPTPSPSATPTPSPSPSPSPSPTTVPTAVPSA
jgi:peptidoglycan hydrolase-like protein with peptidoglycan-binding domain